jgi:hypothetical protein
MKYFYFKHFAFVHGFIKYETEYTKIYHQSHGCYRRQPYLNNKCQITYNRIYSRNKIILFKKINKIKVCSNEVHPLDFTIIILSAGVT